MDFTGLDMQDKKVLFAEASQVREVLFLDDVPFFESGPLELAGPDFRDIMG
jgi:hypothetical protein